MQGDPTAIAFEHDPQLTLQEAEVRGMTTGADEKPLSGNAEGPQPKTVTTNPCSGDDDTRPEAVEATPADPEDCSDVSDPGASDLENTECAIETSDDVHRADDLNPVTAKGTVDSKRVDLQCDGDDFAVPEASAGTEPSPTSALPNPRSPADQPAESNIV